MHNVLQIHTSSLTIDTVHTMQYAVCPSKHSTTVCPPPRSTVRRTDGICPQTFRSGIRPINFLQFNTTTTYQHAQSKNQIVSQSLTVMCSQHFFSLTTTKLCIHLLYHVRYTVYDNSYSHV